MIITILGSGTSQGVPVIACHCQVCSSADSRDKRSRSSIMVSVGEKNVVIDTGPDFRQQMLQADVQKLHGVVFTHEHKDHIAGLDDVRAFNYAMREDMNVFCTERVEEALRREFAYAFSEYKYPGVPEIALNRISSKPFDVAGIHFIPIKVMHLKLPVLGFRIGDFTYITDANYINEAEKAKMKGTKYLVLNALRREPHPSHFTLQEALQLIEELQPEHTWLTHISHQLGTHEEVSQELPPNVSLAYDGLQIEL